MKINCHNPRTSDDIDMKLEPVTKLDKKNKTTSKKIDNDVILGNYDAIYGRFGSIRKPDSRHIVCKSYIFSDSNLLFYENWK